MTRHAERICELANEAAEADEPDIALRALVELRREVDAFVAVHAGRALRAGRSFSDIARALGISRQAAHRRFRDLAPRRRRDRTRPLVATDSARHVVRLAREEAVAAGAPVGSEHILLGVVRTDTETTRALRSSGVTPERVRAYARGNRDQRPDDRDAGSLRRVIKRAAQIALSRGDRALSVQPLLLAAIADPDGGAKRTLSALAVPAAVIEAGDRR